MCRRLKFPPVVLILGWILLVYVQDLHLFRLMFPLLKLYRLLSEPQRAYSFALVRIRSAVQIERIYLLVHIRPRSFAMSKQGFTGQE